MLALVIWSVPPVIYLAAALPSSPSAWCLVSHCLGGVMPQFLASGHRGRAALALCAILTLAFPSTPSRVHNFGRRDTGENDSACCGNAAGALCTSTTL